MANHLELMKKVDALVIDNVMLAKENVLLKEKLTTLETENKSLVHKNSNLIELVENLEEEIEELDNECNRLSDALEENEGQVIHYIAISLDLSTCVPLVSESPIDAGEELIRKCLAKGIPCGGFKVFEKSELL